MKLRSIVLHNYRAFQHTELDVPEGITAIIGNNGTGKSTIIEAVGWALYGSRVARTNKENIKRQDAPPNDECYVTLTFALGDDEYEITRIMTGSSLSTDATVKVNGLVSASSASGATELIEKKLGMDHDAFFTSLVARQKEINALSSKTPGERKRSMLRMLGIDAIEEAVKQVRQDKRDKHQQVEAMQSALKDLDDLKEKRQEHRQAKKDLDSRLKETRSALSSLTSQVTQLRDKREREKQKHERYTELQKQHSTATERLQSKQEQYQQIAKEKQELQQKQQRLQELQPKEKQYRQLKQQKKEMEEQRERHR
ncbi:MAG: SMC family ATPase, partial [Candidatus Thermoplasmatota archaeon]|nr:SMC family ATPase [Candidatus Thermoplasmatota archaeon]